MRLRLKLSFLRIYHIAFCSLDIYLHLSDRSYNKMIRVHHRLPGEPTNLNCTELLFFEMVSSRMANCGFLNGMSTENLNEVSKPALTWNAQTK